MQFDQVRIKLFCARKKYAWAAGASSRPSGQKEQAPPGWRLWIRYMSKGVIVIARVELGRIVLHRGSFQGPCREKAVASLVVLS